MNKITTDHLARRACVYLRQSTPGQVKHNRESQRLQYALVERARELGWQEPEVIDEDLGISGNGVQRNGFDRLLRDVCDGRIGAIFSIEASRLARNGREWHTLLEFCSVVDVLLIDAQTVYDPKRTDDRLLLGMKGAFSEVESATFRERAQSAMKQKAQRGELFQRVPIGYVKAPDDRIERNPDARIRAAIEQIFQKFAELGSVRQVYFWLSQQHIELPVAQGTEAEQRIVWQPARYHAVLSVLKNPTYAGAYAYGRSRTITRIGDGQKRVVRQLRRKREDWAVLIRDHHQGYIGWDVYENNQTLIAHNENARGGAVRGSIKRGEALLAGLLRCGHCGARLLAQYPRPTVIRYQCSGYILNREQACCVMFGGLRADQQVAQQVLQCLAPLGVAAAMEAIVQTRSEQDARVHHQELALEQARYEVARARRQYDAVDATNRLVAAELERRWNEALKTQSQLESELDVLRREQPRAWDQSTEEELIALSRDIPRLWDHPLSMPEHKKRILRIALKEIIATSEDDTIRLVLHWQGGDHTEIRLQKNRTGQHRFVTEADIVEAVCALARIEPDARIASILNKNGRRSAHGQAWTARLVCSLRRNHSIPAYEEGERQARGEISLNEAARALNVTPAIILRMIRLKQLPATQACANAPWILHKADVERQAADRGRQADPQLRDSNQLTLEIQ
jgi:DNA invertase Pin-like site-specific DNA recombinase